MSRDIWFGKVNVIENIQEAQETWRMRVTAPEIARRANPGQFIMMRLEGQRDPLLGRPLAIFKMSDTTLDMVYVPVGRATQLLTQVTSGRCLEMWGPLGNGFPQTAPEVHLLLAAGGVGYTPLWTLAREALKTRDPSRITLCYGVRDKKYLACVDDFLQLGINVKIATDNGTLGHHGYVTDLLEEQLQLKDTYHVMACGPKVMLRAVSMLTQKYAAACHVSLETPMACGMGICFTCVAKCRSHTPAGWDYCRTCVEGPVFSASDIIWEES